MKGVKPIPICFKMRVDVSEQFVDVFKMGVGLHADVLVHMYLDAGRTERQKTALAPTEISEKLIGVEGALDLRDLRADFLTLSADQTGSHSIY